MEDKPSSTASPTTNELGFWMSTALVVGNIVGMGIFVLPAGLAPFGLNAFFGWGLMLLGCLALARVFAHLARLMPEAGGPYGMIRHHLGEPVAFLTLWGYWVSVWMTNAVLAVGVVGYLVRLAPIFTDVPPAAISLVLVWLFVGVNLLGVKVGGEVQVVTTVLKLVPLAAVIALGLWVLLSEPAAYTRSLPTTPISFSLIIAASTTALYSMLGFESATVPAGRVKNPVVTIPRATLLGTLVTAAIYIAASTVPMLLLPQAELGASPAPFVDVLNQWMFTGSGQYLAFFVVISGTGCLNGWTLLSGEVTRTLAAAGTLPAVLAKTNTRGAPVVGLVVSGLLASGMVFMSAQQGLVAQFVWLTNAVTAAALPLYLFTSLTLLLTWHRRRPRLGSSLPTLSLLGITFTGLAFKGLGAEPLLLVAALAALGVVVYLAMRWRRGR